MAVAARQDRLSARDYFPSTGIAILIGLAFISYRGGVSDYGRSDPLAFGSVVASFAGSAVFGFLGMLGTNALLFLLLLAYNLFVKKPPGSRSGF